MTTPTQTLTRRALEAGGLTTAQLARALRVSENTVTSWRVGARDVSGPARILLTLWADDPDHARAVCAIRVDVP